jgi:putative acetyltransferase
MVPHMHIEIRPTRPDHDAVTPLLAQLDAYLGELYPPEANHILDVQALLRPDVLFVAAWSGSEALGCGAVRRMPGEAPTRDQIYGEIKRMFVLPRARGARIGQRILESLEASLTAEGISHALLETGRDQTEAVRLYERCGYRPRASFGGYPDNGLSVFYEKRLG